MNTVTFIFPDKTGQRFGTCRLLWSAQKTIQRYLHEQPLKEEGLLARWMRCSSRNALGQKIKLTYTPKPDDVITMRLAGRSMS